MTYILIKNTQHTVPCQHMISPTRVHIDMMLSRVGLTLRLLPCCAVLIVTLDV